MQFILTFGDGHTRRNRYTIIDAPDKASAVELGYELYGNEWSQIYGIDRKADVVDRWGLIYIDPGT